MSKTDDLSLIKRQFLASLNHEIRTPLSGILGMTDLLLETQLTCDQKEYVDSARLCAENLLQILNGALEFSALSANHVRVEETEFPLRETLEGITAEFLPKAESKGLRLIRNFDPRLPEAAIGDAVRLRQLLVNLLSNAIKFTDQGEVELSAFGDQKDHSTVSLTIMVRDTGIGISPDRVRSIFEGFQRLHNPVSDHSGLGLGLAVSQKLAMLLNGSITVQSQLGRGSTFFVDIPLSLPSQNAKPEQELEKAGGRILVVDDNAIAQTIASHALGRRGYKVQCAADGLAALEAASRATFDLILLDLQMPGLDGFETAERLHRMPAYFQTPIVAVTANCSEDYQERCRQYGMQGFLAKPVRTKDLVETVEQYCTPVLASR
ncbi:MAG TPA: response regulator [Bryobacteraceae bacterium]|nr:response regulator [Bryobacteraceae bacterium]